MSLRQVHPELDPFLRVFKRLRALCTADSEALRRERLAADAEALWGLLERDFGPVLRYTEGRKARLREYKERAVKAVAVPDSGSPRASRDAVAMEVRLRAQDADRAFYEAYLAQPGAEATVARVAALEGRLDAWYAANYRARLSDAAQEACRRAGAKLSRVLGREEYELSLAVRRAARMMEALRVGLGVPARGDGAAGGAATEAVAGVAVEPASHAPPAAGLGLGIGTGAEKGAGSAAGAPPTAESAKHGNN